MIENTSKINETQRLIIEAAITCIEKYGIENVTVRRIAEEARVNIASINYYFRSKANLMHAALKMTIDHMLEDVLNAINKKDLPLKERLEEVFFFMIEGAVRFPRLSTAHLYDAIVCKNYESPGVTGIREMFKHLVARIVDDLPEKSEEKVHFSLMQIFYAYFFLMLAPKFFEFPEKYNLLDSRSQRNLAREYTRLFFTALE